MNLAQRVLLNTSALTVGRLALAVSGLIGVAIATRYLGPDAYASLAIATVFISLTTLIADLGLYTIATREIVREPAEERRVLGNVLGLTLALTATATVVSLVAMVILYGGEDRDLVRIGIVVLLAQLLTVAPAGTAMAFLNAHQRALPLMTGAVAGSAVFLVVLVLARTLDWGFTGVAVAQAGGGVVGGLVPVAIARRSIRVRLGLDLALWRRLLATALPQGGVIILGSLYFRIDLLLLSFLSTDAEVALYGVAYKVVEVLSVLPLLFMFTLFPEIARAAPHSPRLAEIVQIAFTSLQLAALPLVVYFAVFAVPVIEVVGGPGFAGAAPVLRILMISVGLVFLNAVYFNALVALGRQKTLFLFLLAILAVNVPLNLVLVPLAGAEGAAISVTISEVAALILVTRIFGTVGRIPHPHRPVAALLATAAMAAASLAVVQLSGALGGLAVLALGGALGTLAYVGVLVALGAMPREVLDLVDTLRNGRAEPPPPDEPADPGGATADSAPAGPSLGQ